MNEDELPEGFSQNMQEEKQKTRPKFQPPKEDKKPPAANKDPPKEEEKPKPKVCHIHHTRHIVGNIFSQKCKHMTYIDFYLSKALFQIGKLLYVYLWSILKEGVNKTDFYIQYSFVQIV